MLDREKKAIDDDRQVLSVLRESVNDYFDSVPVKPDIDASLAESPFLKELETAHAGVEQTLAPVHSHKDALTALIDETENAVEKTFAAWKERRAEADAALQRVKIELEAESIDYESFRALQRRVDALLAVEPQLEPAMIAHHEFVAKRRDLPAERESLESNALQRLVKTAARLSGKLAPSVRVEVKSSVDYKSVEQNLRSGGGRVSEAMALFRDDPNFSPRLLAEIAAKGQSTLTEKWGLTSVQAGRIANLSTSSLLELEEVPLVVTTSVELNTAPGGTTAQWIAIDDLSKGQQAIAILMMLLLDSDAPLIVDQLEDDLDSRFISTQIVPTVKSEKRRRQFVFSTHNANVPVLADAELVVGLTAEGGHLRRATIEPKHLGAVDKPTVRELIEERLEGGRDAFEARRRRYRPD
jgi:hypothetical protein